MSNETTVEKHEFQAEVQQVLHLMVHSLYSNKEIFLRELVSNASDACDKLRFAAVSDASLYGDDADLRIEVHVDKDAGTVTIRDNGIGMSSDEVVENIGTIARSGTRKFLDALTGDQKRDSQLIGQFGVGFYSGFIVADKVTLVTRKAGEEGGTRWESDGQGTYTLESVEKDTRGTDVVLHLKEDEKEFLEEWRLRSLIQRYSDHISFPIKMLKPASTDEDGNETSPATWEAVNQASALWSRPKSEISDEDYQAFYKHVSNDFNDPLTWAHNRVEGTQSYTTLLFLPKQPPFDMMMGGAKDERKGLKLYVRRVFIMDAAEQLLPAYLRFARGVVDSDDLPLNVSREILQENRLVSKIRASVTKRLLDMIERLTEDSEKYAEFWKHFGEVLKEGPVEDASNREKLLKLMRFASTESKDQTVGLDEYISRMKAEQDKIYYVTADSYQAASNSPHLEVFREKGIEVLLMHDRVDEWMMGHVREYDGKSFQSISKGDLDFSAMEGEDEKKQREETAKQAEPLAKRMAEILKDKVEEVRVSHRLKDSPACLVLKEHDMAVHMQSLMKQAGHSMPGSKPILEINPQHPLIQKADAEADEDRFADYSLLMFEQSWLAEGGLLDDPSAFVKRMNELLAS